MLEKSGDVAGDTADTAGRIASGIVEVPASLASSLFSNAGKGAADALRETGNVASRAAADIENGFGNIFGSVVSEIMNFYTDLKISLFIEFPT